MDDGDQTVSKHRAPFALAPALSPASQQPQKEGSHKRCHKVFDSCCANTCRRYGVWLDLSRVS